MLENKLEQDIIALYDSNLVDLISINQIAGKLGKKYPYINKKVSGLVDLGILKKIVVGRSHLCCLNFANEKTRLLLSLNEINKKEKAQSKDINCYVEENSLKVQISTIVNSRCRLIFVVVDLHDRRMIEKEFPGCTVLDRKEFVDMIIEDADLFKDHKVIYGYERFFELVKEALPELKRRHSPLSY